MAIKISDLDGLLKPYLESARHQLNHPNVFFLTLHQHPIVGGPLNGRFKFWRKDEFFVNRNGERHKYIILKDNCYAVFWSWAGVQ